jgi:cysteine desulfurase family protein (TIGR01976 family)
VRDRFPGANDGWARFDGPAGTQMLDTAIEAQRGYLSGGDSANGGGVFAASEATAQLARGARTSVGRLLGADPGGVIFGPNMTTLMFALTRAIARDLGPGDHLVGTRLDHDANVTPWQLAADDTGATLDLVPFDTASGRLDVERVSAAIGDNTRWVAISGASNALGTVPDVAAVVRGAHERGARVLVDGVHLVPHRPVDVAALGCDAFVTSAYKWYGPHAGILWLAPDLRTGLRPYKVRPAPDGAPERWETGTPSYEAMAATQAAAEFLTDLGVSSLAEQEMAVFDRLLDALLAFDHVTMHGPTDLADRTPTVCFTVDGHHPDKVAAELAAERVAVWSGTYYAVEVMSSLGLTDGAVRAGVSAYTSDDDVDRLVDAIRRLG